MIAPESTCLPLPSSEKYVMELDQSLGLLYYMFLIVVEEKILLSEFLAFQVIYFPLIFPDSFQKITHPSSSESSLESPSWVEKLII